jgi:hypothetical protein
MRMGGQESQRVRMQVRECAKALVMACKQTLGIPVFLVGHVTKGGDLAGPKTLEHIVDTTLYLEGEEGTSCRILRCSKNRFALHTFPATVVHRCPHSLLFQMIGETNPVMRDFHKP